jgi:hypothetical protein
VQDRIQFIVDCAAQRRLIRLVYQKVEDTSGIERLVEPYRFQESHGNLMLQCWQRDPESTDYTCWRNFRLDRILELGDGGATFEPRCDVTICRGEVHAFEMGVEPIQTSGPTVDYGSFVERAMLDGRLTAAEAGEAEQLKGQLGIGDVRAAHARAFLNVLQEVLKDGVVTDVEEEYLGRARRFLKRLGWAP